MIYFQDLPDEPDFPPPTVRDSPLEQPQQSTEQSGTSTLTEEARPSTSRAPCTPPPHQDRLIIPLSSPLPASPEEEIPLTRSQKKLAFFQGQNVEELSDVKRTIVELPQINKLLQDLRCHECLSDEGLKLQTPTRYGLAVKIEAVCNGCGMLLSNQFTSARNATSPSHTKPFVTNKATVTASLLSGMGRYSFNNFYESLEMPGLHQKTFNNIAKRLYSQNERLADQVFSKAATFVRREHIRQYALDVGDEDIIDLSVSFDGSWLTIGHKSLIGIGCVMDILTGLIWMGMFAVYTATYVHKVMHS